MKRIGIILVSLLVGCTTTYQISEHEYAVTQATEERSSFGTNTGGARIAYCDRRENPVSSWTEPFASKWIYDVNCVPQTPWQVVSSPGQGGQIVSGVAQAGGLIGLGVLTNVGGSTVSATQSQSMTAPAATVKGHK